MYPRIQSDFLLNKKQYGVLLYVEANHFFHNCKARILCNMVSEVGMSEYCGFKELIEALNVKDDGPSFVILLLDRTVPKAVIKKMGITSEEVEQHPGSPTQALT